MMLTLYKTILSLAAPIVALVFALSPNRRPLLARFRPRLPRFQSPPVWVHACSVGEVNTARPILESLRARWPDIPILLTVSTPTGKARAHEIFGGQPIAWFPFDHPFIVRRFLRTVQPKLLILIETELWPCVIHQTRDAGTPVILVNGRLSDAHAQSYERFSALYRPIIERLSAAGMQNERYADRLRSLGADAEIISVTGNVKYDSTPDRLPEAERTQLRRELGISPKAPVIVFGSTRPGDEELAVECWHTLKEADATTVLIVAPRHLERVPGVTQALAGDSLHLRSQLDSNAAPLEGCGVLLDTHGELARIYAIATVAVVGGSFFEGVDGHNPIEPAAQGTPTLFGPYMRNFQDAADALLAHQGAVHVDSPDALCGELKQLLSDPQARERLGQNALECVAQNRDATDRTLDLIQKVLGQE